MNIDIDQITTQLTEEAHGEGGQKRAIAQNLESFESKVINYSDLSESEKAIFDSFVDFVIQKANE